MFCCQTQAWFFVELNKHMICKKVGVLGPRADLGDVQEVRCLNRLIRYVQPAFKSADHAYMELEGDPRHLEILAKQEGLDMDSKPLSTPGVKMPRDTDETPLDENDRSNYRSRAMRYAYLAQDRPELQYSAKELARKLNEPTRWGRPCRLPSLATATRISLAACERGVRRAEHSASSGSTW